MKTMEPIYLLSGPQVATHCRADLKTIHNWVNAGQIRSFRTPGRHLRFRVEDVVAFLERYGYPVPPELQRFTRRVVVVIDPDQEAQRVLGAALSPRHVIKGYDCPVKALLAIRRDQPDLIVSEVELPSIDGYRMVERLSCESEAEAPTGCPVVVYTRQGDELECQRAGAAALVRKPDVKALRRLVGQMLAQRATA